MYYIRLNWIRTLRTLPILNQIKHMYFWLAKVVPVLIVHGSYLLFNILGWPLIFKGFGHPGLRFSLLWSGVELFCPGTGAGKFCRFEVWGCLSPPSWTRRLPPALVWAWPMGLFPSRCRSFIMVIYRLKICYCS